MILSHKIRLEPTRQQAEYFSRAAGTARFVWNWALAEWKRRYASGEKPKAAALKKQFNQIKYEQFPWLKDVHRDSHSQPFANLQKAFRKFFKKEARYPKFKCRGKSSDSFYVANDKLQIKDRKVKLPLVGWVKLSETLRFSGKIMAATVSRVADHWYISIQVDVGDYQKPTTGNSTVGVDLGLTTLATLSTGEKFESPKPLKNSLKKLRRLQRSHSRRVKGSVRRNRKRKQISKLYSRIRNIRQDCFHKLTTYLCKNHAEVVIEDLCVKGMFRTRLSKSLSDACFGEIRRQLEYKSKIYGNRLVVADRWYASSKTCNRCGWVKKDLTLSDRIFVCDSCGHTNDRDWNAAENLRDYSENTGGLSGIHAQGHSSCSVSGEPETTGMVELRTKPCSPVSTN